MKKVLIILMVLMMCVSMCACESIKGSESKGESEIEITTEDSLVESIVESIGDNSNTSEPKETYYKIGDTVSTDIVEFTLDDAALAIALYNGTQNAFLPKEYNPEEDKNNPYVAAKGSSFVAYTYTVKNIDRAQLTLEVENFSYVKYKEKTHKETENCAVYRYESYSYRDAYGKYKTEEPNKWYRDYSRIIAMNAGTKETHRAYITVKSDADTLTDEFLITFKLPNSKGNITKFTYQINAE